MKRSLAVLSLIVLAQIVAPGLLMQTCGAVSCFEAKVYQVACCCSSSAGTESETGANCCDSDATQQPDSDSSENACDCIIETADSPVLPHPAASSKIEFQEVFIESILSGTFQTAKRQDDAAIAPIRQQAPPLIGTQLLAIFCKIQV